VVEREGGAFDVVLMDVHMPVMSGHEATRELRRRWSKDELPIVALTAAALMSEQEQSLSLGMNDFIAKPFDAERLKSALLRWGVRKAATAR
jgi:CheY-like chemotaxis protein